MIHDAIVVGSGPAGATAAAALVERGRTVLMLDVGEMDDRYAPLIPDVPFTELRRTDADQHRYLLGDDFEGIPLAGVGTGAQLTPPRMYVTRTPEFLRINAPDFRVAESLALGGLANAWGAGVFEFDEHELRDWPIPARELRPHYDAVAARIGVTAAEDDLSRFFPRPNRALTPPEIDSNARQVLRRYEAVRATLNARGFFVGRVPLAIATEPHAGRGPITYRDMEFWADADRSVYRPRFTIEELRRSSRFTYVSRQVALRFEESADAVDVTARHVDDGSTQRFRARTLLLAAGTLGTARIVLRSRERFGTRVPLLCNPYTYAPAVNWRMFGQETLDRRHSLAQLSAVYQPRLADGARGSVQVQLYSYRSLLTFRLLGETPLGFRESLRAMRLLLPALVILGINHDDSRSERKYCELRHAPDGADVLSVTYALTPEEQRRIAEREREVLRLFRQLGVWAIKRVHPGHGSSIHYAGTFPMTRDGGELTTAGDGRLHGLRAVYLVDGSVLPYLPAKGLTFTIMANADRVAGIVAKQLS